MAQMTRSKIKHSETSDKLHRTEMQKELVIQKLREQGCRITKQRQILLNVILQEECTSCKEIYYKAASIDPGIGAATVYRMVNVLEEIGAISRKNLYRVSCDMDCGENDICMIELDDNTVCRLSSKNWYKVISAGLRAYGYTQEQTVKRIMDVPLNTEK